MRSLNISGKRFGSVLAIEPTDSRIHGVVVWKCLCDCGNECFIPCNRLTYGTTKSCGCARNKYQYGESSFNNLVSKYKYSARKRNIEWKLSSEECKSMFENNCHYCNTAPSKITTGNGYNGDYTYNGIDRMNPTEGYIKSNCVSCCYICNRAKNNMTYNNFINWIQKLRRDWL